MTLCMYCMKSPIDDTGVFMDNYPVIHLGPNPEALQSATVVFYRNYLYTLYNPEKNLRIQATEVSRVISSPPASPASYTCILFHTYRLSSLDQCIEPHLHKWSSLEGHHIAKTKAQSRPRGVSLFGLRNNPRAGI